MTLFWHPTGPRITYEDGLLEVENLNPQVATHWVMSRAEMLRLGWRCIAAALRDCEIARLMAGKNRND